MHRPGDEEPEPDEKWDRRERPMDHFFTDEELEAMYREEAGNPLNDDEEWKDETKTIIRRKPFGSS